MRFWNILLVVIFEVALSSRAISDDLDTKTAVSFVNGLGILDATKVKCGDYVKFDDADVMMLEGVFSSYLDSHASSRNQFNEFRAQANADQSKRFVTDTHPMKIKCSLSTTSVKITFDMMPKHYKIHFQQKN
jgi:hypothetical protein